MTAHEEDRHQWALETAAAIRAGDLAAVDLAAVADEVELVARADVHELRSRLEQIFEHLLKLKLTTGQIRKYNEGGWQASIIRQRSEIQSLVEASPSLRNRIPELVPKAYRTAAAAVRASLDVTAPLECPFSMIEALGAESES
jgi:hypothetical protein